MKSIDLNVGVIADAIEKADVDATIDRAYVGRKMVFPVHETCLGISVGEPHHMLAIMAALGSIDYDTAQRLLDRVHSDTLEPGQIYYFPGVQATGALTAYDEEEDDV